MIKNRLELQNKLEKRRNGFTMIAKVRMVQDNCIDRKRRIKTYMVTGQDINEIIKLCNNTTYDDYWWCERILNIEIV